MRDLIDLTNFWRENASRELVLCTLIGRRGSSYRLPGAKKIVSMRDASSGLLSGGCLERDIETAARERQGQLPFIQSFSTLAEEDRWLGYQAGCAGEIDILFERLPISFDDHKLYIPFGPRLFGQEPKAAGVSVSLKGPSLGKRQWAETPFHSEDHFFDRWIEPIDLVIIGAGLDAPPFLGLSQSLGWSIRFIDYREIDFASFCASPTIIALDAIGAELPQGPRVALVLMTHNFEADLSIMSQLRGQTFGYLACLGPKQRFEQLSKDLKNRFGVEIEDIKAAHIHAPAGLLPRQTTPETIALSVVAQIQSVLG